MLARIRIMAIKSLLEKDYPTLQFHAHKLKTSIDHFSIECLTDEIRQIEKYAKEEVNLELLPPLIKKLETELKKTIIEIKADFHIS